MYHINEKKKKIECMRPYYDEKEKKRKIPKMSRSFHFPAKRIPIFVILCAYMYTLLLLFKVFALFSVLTNKRRQQHQQQRHTQKKKQ